MWNYCPTWQGYIKMYTFFKSCMLKRQTVILMVPVQRVKKELMFFLTTARLLPSVIRERLLQYLLSTVLWIAWLTLDVYERDGLNDHYYLSLCPSLPLSVSLWSIYMAIRWKIRALCSLSVKQGEAGNKNTPIKTCGRGNFTHNPDTSTHTIDKFVVWHLFSGMHLNTI